MGTSFPFLKIARERGVPYGVIIRFAQAIENLDRWPSNEVKNLSFETRMEVLDAVTEEYERRSTQGALVKR